MALAIGQFFLRFILFWLKILASCLFVMFLQVQIGQKTLEEWLEQGLRHSSFSRYLQETTIAGRDKVYEKFPNLKGVAQHRIVLNKTVLELHSGLLNQLKKSLDDFEGYPLEERLPASPNAVEVPPSPPTQEESVPL